MFKRSQKITPQPSFKGSSPVQSSLIPSNTLSGEYASKSTDNTNSNPYINQEYTLPPQRQARNSVPSPELNPYANVGNYGTANSNSYVYQQDAHPRSKSYSYGSSPTYTQDPLKGSLYEAANADYQNFYGGNSARKQSFVSYETSRNQLFARASKPSSQIKRQSEPSNSTSLPNSTGQNELYMTASELEKTQPSFNNSIKYTFETDKDCDSDEEKIEDIKRQIRGAQDDTLRAAQQAIDAANRAGASGSNAAEMLHEQGARLSNAKYNFALIDAQNDIAEIHAKDLKIATRGLFVPKVGRNPDKDLPGAQQRVDHIRQKKDLYQWEQKVQQTDSQQKASQAQRNALLGKSRGKYDLEGSDDDEEEEFKNEAKERQINRAIDAIEQHTQNLHSMAVDMNGVIIKQNTELDQMINDADRLDIHVNLNTDRLNRIK